MEKRINSTEKENIRKENDRKKRYLWQYQECKRELERLEEEKEKKPEQPEWKERLLDVFLGGKVNAK